MNHRPIFLALILTCAIGALALRLPRLDARHVHGDEAVHAYKCNELYNTGTYHYDPHEYHGPTLYYLTLPVRWLSGADSFANTTIAMHRLVPVIFGIGLILLLPLLADGLGRSAVICAAILTAISHALVFYSRYYIQETLLVFFTLLTITAGWRFARSRHIGWALLAGAGVGLMHATKETCLIAWGAMLAALAITLWISRNRTETNYHQHRQLAARLLAGLALAIFISVLFYSAFFTHAAGPLDSLRTYHTYFDRAGSHGVHDHPWHYYLHQLLYWRPAPGPSWSEAFILFLALFGLLAALRPRLAPRAHPPLLRFLALYTLLLTVIYSAIPYKTPWCMLGFLHGLILLAGVGCIVLLRLLHFPLLQAAAASALLIGAAHLGRQAWVGSTRFANDVRNPYVYAHPVADVEKLTRLVTRLANSLPADQSPLIKVITRNEWPLPWYLRGFEHVGYWAAVPADPDADIAIVGTSFRDDFEQQRRASYQVSYFGLRRDEVVLVYVRQPLWDQFIARMRAATTEPADE